ncbi:MAG: IS1595 family transposase [Nitrospira sp.]|nr:IS1595 family transposase [Nitrospira sp.]
MSIMGLFDTLASEEACEKHLIAVRWPEGLVCPKCKSREFYDRLRTRRSYKCRLCHHVVSPTAGTIFHRTRTSLREWFVALFLIAGDKRGLSALFLAEQIGVSYPTAWAMLQRIRHAMAKRDAQYMLSGHVEMDEMFIGAPTEGKKRGRGTEQTPVIVAVSFSPTKDGKEYVGFAKLRAVDTIDAPTIVKFAKGVIEKGSTVRTDGYTVYPPLEEHGFVHDRHPVGKRKAHVILPHVHTFISNLRSFVMGTHHGLDETHLQHYLDEFCWRFNRRKCHHQMFDRLLLACIEKEEMPFCALTE